MRSLWLSGAALALIASGCGNATTPPPQRDLAVYSEAGRDAPATGDRARGDGAGAGERRLTDLPAGQEARGDKKSGDALVADCKTMEKTYAAALATARVCYPALPTIQCTLVVDDELSCPCTTYVDKAHALEITLMADLKVQWAKLGCSKGVICPTVACKIPSGADCVASSGTSGTCVDK